MVPYNRTKAYLHLEQCLEPCIYLSAPNTSLMGSLVLVTGHILFATICTNKCGTGFNLITFGCWSEFE